MEMFLDRLNNLLFSLNMPPVPAGAQHATGRLDKDNNFVDHNPQPIHKVLDGIDKVVGIITRHRHSAVCYAGTKTIKVLAQEATVGERLRRLERHVSANKTSAMFWLGAEGDS